MVEPFPATFRRSPRRARPAVCWGSPGGGCPACVRTSSPSRHASPASTITRCSMVGSSHLTSHLWTPVPIDARAGGHRRRYPALVHGRPGHVSQPCTFRRLRRQTDADLWAVLDVLTLIVLGSGFVPLVVRPRTARGTARRGGGIEAVDLHHPRAVGRTWRRWPVSPPLLGDGASGCPARFGLGLPAVIGTWPLLRR